MAKVFITASLPGKAVELLQRAGLKVTIHHGPQRLTEAGLLQAMNEYDGLITLLSDLITTEMLARAGSQLKIIANYAVGFDNIDIKTAQAKGIVITNTPGVVTYSVAEHTIALMLALARRLVEADQFVRAGKYHGWEPELLLGMELRGKTLGIVGGGRIGFETARIAQLGFGMRILYNDLKPRPMFGQGITAQFVLELDRLLPEVDVLSLHVPLLPSTFHLMQAARFKLLKPTALIINTARGAVIDEQALLEALKAGSLRGAALDVFEKEPHLTPGLAEMANVILTPHVASATQETRTAMAEMAAQNVLAVLHGKAPLTPVVIES